MSVKYLIGAVFETALKVLVLAAVIMFVFADRPVSSSEGRTITIGIAEDADIMDIAKMLKERGLIADEKLFVVQEFLSAYHNEILPGIYDLNTNMTAEQMLEVMSTPVKETEDAASE